jgi:RNA polymerase sigma factor (sigma-70 family)
VLFEEHLAAINETIAIVCHRKRLSAEERDEFRSIAYLHVLEGDCAVLRRFAGRSSLRTYLEIVIHRLFLDYRNATWGRWRPSALARQSGEAAIALERLVARDGWTLNEALHMMPAFDVDRRQLQDIAARLPMRPRRRYLHQGVLADVPDRASAIDQRLIWKELGGPAARVVTALRAAVARLTRTDQLILSLRFRDGLRINVIAERLGFPPKQLYRRIERLLRMLRRELEANGCAALALTLAREDRWYDVVA